MFFGDPQYTDESSSKVHATLNYIAQHPGSYAVLTLITRHRSSGMSVTEEHAENLSVKLDPNRANIELANGVQVIRCLTKGGKKCEIFLARPETRHFEPALVLLEAD